ncbi:hypothetical protein SEVIR_7G336600v4 [Setaria viridis]|uniref:Uncharacterized protein n=1 Tax=Setaria viridis TaxID=4556 RepID=A0A4V6D4V2_SETVI|nr:hypothetical protein SEVIR_7G336600v2 [Setaria viridis]
MAIPVARVHLAMAHAALPGLLPTPPKCMMSPLLPTPPCVIVILPTRSPPPKPSRADAAERWDAHKTEPAAGSPTSSSSSAGGQRSLYGESSSPGRASSCERWDRNKKKIAAAAASSSASRTSSPGRSSSSRADSEEKWDARKKPVSLSSSSSSARSNNKGCDGSSRRRANSRATTTAAGRWDAHKKPTAALRTNEIDDDDGESSTGSNDMGYLDMPLPRPLPHRELYYAGPGFIAAAPDPSMLPMPSSLMIRVR